MPHLGRVAPLAQALLQKRIEVAGSVIHMASADNGLTWFTVDKTLQHLPDAGVHVMAPPTADIGINKGEKKPKMLKAMRAKIARRGRREDSTPRKRTLLAEKALVMRDASKPPQGLILTHLTEPDPPNCHPMPPSGARNNVSLLQHRYTSLKKD